MNTVGDPIAEEELETITLPKQALYGRSRNPFNWKWISSELANIDSEYQVVLEENMYLYMIKNFAVIHKRSRKSKWSAQGLSMV